MPSLTHSCGPIQSGRAWFTTTPSKLARESKQDRQSTSPVVVRRRKGEITRLKAPVKKS